MRTEHLGPSAAAHRLLAGLAAILAVVLVAVPAGASAHGASTPAGGLTDWTTYGFDLQRTGFNPNETTLTPATVGGLHRSWSFDLGSVTIMQPVVATGVDVGGTSTDLVYIGDEHGDLFALDAGSGHEVWHRDLGSEDTDCGDMPDTVFGVSGAPFIDRANGRLFVVGGDGRLYALRLADGTTLPGWPVAVTNHPDHEHTYGAVNVEGGIAYAEIASYCDISPYRGAVVPVDIAAHQRLRAFYPAGRNVSGGGIWGPGGVSIDPATGHVFAATGNALTNPESYRYSEDVVELSPSLQVLGANYPGLVGGDVDFGATPILYHAPACPPQVAAKNKTGILVVYARGDVSSGPTQRLQVANVDDSQFNGIPAWWPEGRLLFIGNSSDSNSDVFRHGMVALQVRRDCSLALAWQRTVGPNFSSVGPPTVAGGVVYYGDGPGNRLLAFDARTGAKLWSSGSTIGGGIFAAPTVVDGQVFVGAWDGTFYAFGL